MGIWKNIINNLYDAIIPLSPEYDPLEITMNKIIINEEAILFPVASVNSGRAHIWFIERDIIYPSASYEITDKSFINHDITFRKMIFVHLNRFMLLFSIIPIE